MVTLEKSHKSQINRMSQRESACHVYDFTQPIDGDHGKTKDQMMSWCNEWGKYWLFQGETSDNGYKHWQGIISLKKPLRPSAAANTIRKYTWCPGYIAVHHYEANEQTAKSVDDFRAGYATKIQTRTEGPYASDDPLPAVLPDCYDLGGKLNILQEDIIYCWKGLVMRDILFVHGTKGCCGKSCLAQWMARTMPNIILVPPSMASSEDMIQWICDMIPKHRQNEPWTVIMDIPRGLRGEESWRKWMSTIEMVAGGWVYDKRYSGEQRFVFPIKAIVFSNEEPKGDNLTVDRFCMIDCDEYANVLPVYRVNRKRKWDRITKEFVYE